MKSDMATRSVKRRFTFQSLPAKSLPVTYRNNLFYQLFYQKGGHMGKGDQRSKRGKIWRGTTGKSRPKKKKKKSNEETASREE